MATVDVNAASDDLLNDAAAISVKLEKKASNNQKSSTESSSSNRKNSSTTPEIKIEDTSDQGYTIQNVEKLSSGESIKVGPQNFYKVEKLGNGFCGKVYLVQSQGLRNNGIFAMKIINKAEMIKRDRVRRVLTEHDILAISNHPFVVTLHYSFQTPKHLYLVMTYCAGGEFFAMLHRQKNRRFSEASAAFYAAEVLIALEYLHLLGLIYRDLKPENLLVHESGHIMLTDFDLSTSHLAKSKLNVSPSRKKQLWFRLKSGKVMLQPPRRRPSLCEGWCGTSSPYPEVDTESHLNDVPKRLSFVGTHEYIAPEIISEDGYAGSVDWWSFGVLVYEMVYGRTPFRGPTDMDTLENIVGYEVVFPKDIKVSDVCKDLLSRLLHKDVACRLTNPVEIKNHPFFKDIHWALIRNEKPPIIPKVENVLDTGNFNKYAGDAESDDELPLHPSSPDKDKKRSNIPLSESLKKPEVQKMFSSYKYSNPTAGENGFWKGDLSSSPTLH